MRRLIRGVGALLLAGSACMLEAQSSTVFDDGFELAFGQPTSDAEAARFLNQASFGATAAGIAQVRGMGIPSWVEQQLSTAPTLSRPYLENLAVSENLAGASLDQAHRVQRWVDVAVTAPDQLRQRVAWALGQIVVVSDQNDSLSGEPVMMAEWNDLLVRNAFGNYRTLLAEALRSPMMGRYLTHLRNRKFEITPRCYDQRPPLNDDTNLSTPGLEYHDCTREDATNNFTMAPRIAKYNLPSGGLITPDENFARELMQLFSIGLVQREADFEPILDPDTGVGLPTYSQATVTTLSRVMTGLGHACSGNRTVAGRSIERSCGCTGSDCSYVTGNFFATPPSLTINGQGGLVHPDRYEPMLCYPRYHDTGRDRTGFQLPGTTPTHPPGATIELAPGEAIPGGTPDAAKQVVVGGTQTLTLAEVDAGVARPSATHCDNVTTSSSAADKAKCIDYCNSGLAAAVDLLFNHPNTAVMVSRQLIQRLVSSTPSPAYIARVAAAFADNGQGVRGDLRAVVKAVLYDVEARRPPTHPEQSPQAGKPREPLLKMIHLWRAFGAVPGAGANYPRWPRPAVCGRGSWPQCAYQQRPLGAPSVFNFFEPDYRAPGDVAEAGLYSPELQIINENSSILAANDMYQQLCSHRAQTTSPNSHNCHGPLRSPPPTEYAYIPDAQLDGLPGGSCGTSCTAADDAALIAALDARLFGGTMSGQLGDLANPGNLAANTGTRGTLFRLLRTGITGNMGEAVAQNARRREILYLIHLAAISPDYATQR